MRLMLMKPAVWVGLLAGRISVAQAQATETTVLTPVPCAADVLQRCINAGGNFCSSFNDNQGRTVASICCEITVTGGSRRLGTEEGFLTVPSEEDVFLHRLLQDEDQCREFIDDDDNVDDDDDTTTTTWTTTDSTWGDPHMRGLRGQRFDWSGVDGGWYSLIKDGNADLHINVRLTAPLTDEFPDRQLMTSLSVITEGHSLVIEFANPYNVDTDGCPEGVSPCLANGGLRMIVDGQQVDELLGFSRQVPVADGAITVSASNLPVECRQFGGDRIWASMFQDMMEGRRQLLSGESLEEWILRNDHNMAAPGWCAKYITENDLADLQSTHAIFKIETTTVTVRLNAGVNYQGNGELNWDGRVLPDLEFWQMDVGMDGLDVDNPTLSGLLGETSRPVYDENGQAVMEGFNAFRGTVEDYRVSSALDVHFPLLDQTQEGQD